MYPFHFFFFLILQILKQSCTEILSVEPSSVCVNGEWILMLQSVPAGSGPPFTACLLNLWHLSKRNWKDVSISSSGEEASLGVDQNGPLKSGTWTPQALVSWSPTFLACGPLKCTLHQWLWRAHENHVSIQREEELLRSELLKPIFHKQKARSERSYPLKSFDSDSSPPHGGVATPQVRNHWSK